MIIPELLHKVRRCPEPTCIKCHCNECEGARMTTKKFIVGQVHDHQLTNLYFIWAGVGIELPLKFWERKASGSNYSG